MKLLFDENLSFRLVESLASAFPESTHVGAVGLTGAVDAVIWDYARARGYTIVTKDDDFRSLSLVRGAPPKVIWLRVGNASTQRIESILRGGKSICENFDTTSEATLLVLTANP